MSLYALMAWVRSTFPREVRLKVTSNRTRWDLNFNSGYFQSCSGIVELKLAGVVNDAIRLDKSRTGRPHVEAANLEVWLWLGAVKYVGLMDSGSNASEGSVCQEVAHTLERLSISRHLKGLPATNGSQRLRASQGNKYEVFCDCQRHGGLHDSCGM